MELAGSRTEANLKKALAGECQARSMYDFVASRVRKEGYVGMAQKIEAIADNEKAHAKLWNRALHGNQQTTQNIEDCIAGEHYEATEMYVKFAKEAREDGFTDIAKLFELVAEVEKEHEAAFKAMLKDLQEGAVFTKSSETRWVCLNCGHVHFGKSAPEKCPVCAHAQGNFTESLT
jgi:rubrerythrin